MASQNKKQSSLEKKLEVPLPLSIWWFIAGMFLLFFGVFIFATYHFSNFIDAKGGTWNIFTVIRPNLTPYSGPEDIRWGTFYIPITALKKFYLLAPVSVLFGVIMMGLRHLTMQSFLGKYNKNSP